MSENSGCTLDENTRRYYLDTMGVQCWQPLEPEQAGAKSPELADGIDTAGLGEQTTESIDFAATLEQQVAACQQCDLQRTRQKVIISRGSRKAELVFVLLAPERSDESNAMLCSGETGELFRKMLAAIDIDIDDVCITTLLKCALPDSHTVSPAEVNACSPYLRQQVEQLQPKFVIVLGEPTAQCLLQKKQPLDVLREMTNLAAQKRQHDSAGEFAGRPLLVTYSPRELLQQVQNKRKAWTDLQLLQSLLRD